jgi:hypothetical protein
MAGRLTDCCAEGQLSDEASAQWHLSLDLAQAPAHSPLVPFLRKMLQSFISAFARNMGWSNIALSDPAPATCNRPSMRSYN